MKPSGHPLAGLIDDLAEFIADRVVQKLASGTNSDFVDQSSSPLGPRRHISAIRDGKLRGVRVGRRYLARRQDVDDLVGTPKPQGGANGQHHSLGADAVDALAEELGLGRPSEQAKRVCRRPSSEDDRCLTGHDGMDRNER